MAVFPILEKVPANRSWFPFESRIYGLKVLDLRQTTWSLSLYFGVGYLLVVKSQGTVVKLTTTLTAEALHHFHY